jgi:hypothetical protein
VIRFAVSSPAQWLARFRALALCAGAGCLATFYYHRLGAGSALAILAFLSATNAWNLQRFVDAQKSPQFRIREYK